MKHRRFCTAFIMFSILLFIAGSVWTIIYTRTFRSIDFEQVCEKDYNTEKGKEHFWFTIRSPEFSGFYSEESLDTLGVDYNGVTFDYDRYTYIITIGHELLNIEYSRNDMKNRICGIFGKQYVGHVTLKEEATDKVYIYRINKMDIDCDYHEPRRAVTFSS